jgi:hypothetical protein
MAARHRTSRVRFIWTAGLLALVAATAPAAEEIPLFSEELAQRVEPGTWPFVAEYRRDRKRLEFVAGIHVFTDDNPTTKAIRTSFDRLAPQIVILEGFPTELGKDPEPILYTLRRRGASGADPFAKTEVAYAINLAQASKVPFIGGELTPRQQLDAVVAKGFDQDDVLFTTGLAMLGFQLSGSSAPPGDATAFALAYAHVSRAVAGPTGTPAISEPQFKAIYMRLYGVDPLTDPRLKTRADPGPDSLPGRISAENMRARDEHLLATIEQQLTDYDRALVVYGGSHWTTLSAALERRYGRPVMHISGQTGPGP